MNHLAEAKKEFKSIITDYMLPLFHHKGNPYIKQIKSNNTKYISYEFNGGDMIKLIFYPCIATKDAPSPFFCEVKTAFEDEESTKRIISLLQPIFRELLRVAEYNCYQNKVKQQRYYSKIQVKRESFKSRTFDLAFEFGMCLYLLGDQSNAAKFHSILCKMIDWTTKTYEGKNVSFGIIVDFDCEAPEENVSYLDFLKNDSSAVFSDGIFSGILLDKEGRLISSLSLDNIALEVVKQEIFVPYQFCDIAKFCTGHTLGIIVLENGEILLIKERAIVFAKRGTKWIFFDWQKIKNGLQPYFEKCETSISQMKAIYCTLLDVSFAHTGGCLAIISKDADDNDISEIIKDRFDLYVKGKVLEQIKPKIQEKMDVLKYLLTNSNKEVSNFYEIEKPLRKEILSLDGATVISIDGQFYCAGSIVSVPGSSSGGGRSAAAEQLAKLGIGIKISEDGYIEAYGKSFDEDSNTEVVPLFMIK